MWSCLATSRATPRCWAWNDCDAGLGRGCGQGRGPSTGRVCDCGVRPPWRCHSSSGSTRWPETVHAMDRVLLALAADRLLFPPWRAENRVESTVESIGLEPSDLPWFTSPSSVPPPLLRPASGCCCSAGHGATTPSVLSWSTVSCSPAAGSGSLGDQNSWPRAASGQSASSPPRQLQRYSYLQLTFARRSQHGNSDVPTGQ